MGSLGVNLEVAMFGIKLKTLKSSGRFYDLNIGFSLQTFTSTLNWVIRDQPVFVAIFGIKSNVLLRPLRNYAFIVFKNGNPEPL